MIRSVCRVVVTASKLTLPVGMVRNTDSLLTNSATVWNGLLKAYGLGLAYVTPAQGLPGLVTRLPSGQVPRKSMKLGKDDSAACGGAPLFSLLDSPRSLALWIRSAPRLTLIRLPMA